MFLFKGGGKLEFVFRAGVALWALFILVLGILITLGITEQKDLFYSPIIVIGPALIVLTMGLFFFALIRIIITAMLKQYTLTAGYVVYAGLIGLLILPMAVALYDRYQLLGSLF